MGKTKPILVQKFGGTSLSSVEARQRAIHHIKQAVAQGFQLVVVVSAMGRKGDPYATDTLLGLIGGKESLITARDKDLLLTCGETIAAVTLCNLLQSAELPACALTGGQAGILTNDEFGNAQIVSIQPSRIYEVLESGQIAVVTGFQGRTAGGEASTLGRGGSDTTATALGAALSAERVDIFTDVEGVLTADPKIVDYARRLDRVSYAEICNMAYNGAKVVHPRAVEFAMQAGIPLRIRSTFSDDEGTLVAAEPASSKEPGVVNERQIVGIAHAAGVAQFQVQAEPHRQLHSALQLDAFQTLARLKISVDFIHVNPSGIAFTVSDDHADRAADALRSLGYDPSIVPHCAKVTVIGGGMNGIPGIMAGIVEALSLADIAILQSADSNATIAVLVRENQMDMAVKVLHDRFIGTSNSV